MSSDCRRWIRVPAAFRRQESKQRPCRARVRFKSKGLLGIAAPKSRKLLSNCLVFLLVGGCMWQVACVGGSLGANTTTGTPAGICSDIVTGAAGSNQHTTTIKLTAK